MIQMGVDLGDARCGIAICDASGTLAAPYDTLSVRGKRDAAQKIAALAEELLVERIVVGLPLRTDGTKGDRALRAEAFCALLRELVSVPVLLRDERFTTVEAYQLLREAGKNRKKGKKEVDALAAVLILQSFLDER